MKIVKSFRLNPDLLEKADKKNLNLVKLFEEFLTGILKDKKCPTCGKKIN